MRAIPSQSWDADLLRHGPQEGAQFAGDGHDDVMGASAPGARASIPVAQPPVSFPTEILAAFGHLFQPELAMATHVRRVTRGPGAFAQGASGMGSARFGAAALTTALVAGIFRRGAAERTPAWSGGQNA